MQQADMPLRAKVNTLPGTCVLGPNPRSTRGHHRTYQNHGTLSNQPIAGAIL